MSASFATRVIRRGGNDVRLLRTCRLEIVGGPEAGRGALVDRPVYRIGAHESNDLVLTDDLVSQQHLELVVEPEGLRIKDLASSNGTFLGSARVGEVMITEPTTLLLGSTMLRLEPTDQETEVPSSQASEFGPVLGCSAVMRELYLKLEAVAASDCSILIEGETGVGKELVAEGVHQASTRSEGPFVVVDCGSLAEDLVESELFGHVRGAFTGAHEERRGLLEAASGGTVFLDEVGELPLPLQVKLLGALERRQVRPIGAKEMRPVDVRVMAATNRDLAREVNTGRFRSDLFYRLAVVRLRLPPLRERLQDLPMLARSFLTELRERYGNDVPEELSALTLARMAGQVWPGNVRELKNAVERAALRVLEEAPDAARPPAFVEQRDRFLAEFDHRYLMGALKENEFNVTRAARATGLQRSYFQRLLRKNGISAQALRRR